MIFIQDERHAGFGTAEVEAISLAGGVGHFRIEAQIGFISRARDAASGRAAIVSIRGELEVADGMRGFHRVARLEPGPTYSGVRAWPSNGEVRTQFTLEADMSSERVAKLEEIRSRHHDHDLQFKLTLYALVAGESDPLNHVYTYGSAPFTVEQSTWLKSLRKAGFSNCLLVEIPLYEAMNSRELADSSARLKEAWAHFHEGHYKASIVTCRDVLNALSKALGDKDTGATEPKATLFSDVMSMTKDQRIRLIRRAVRVFTNLAHHSEEMESGTQWEREDAECALTMTSALVRRLGSSRLDTSPQAKAPRKSSVRKSI